jgi:dTMP kinase
LGRGLLISLEGVEGSGKTTQLKLLAQFLEGMGRRVLKTREPGGTALGEQIRTLLLRAEGVKISPWSELLLYLSARAQLVEEVIRPAIGEGAIVLCDRYLDATVAYQGYGRRLDLEIVEQLNRAVVGETIPDLTLLLDLEASSGLIRISGRDRDRLEGEDLTFHERVRRGYLEVASRHPERIRVIPAGGPIDQVAERIREHLSSFPLCPSTQG